MIRWLWKIRSTKGTYSDALRVSTLLDKARIELAERVYKKPSLALQRLEKAFDSSSTMALSARGNTRSGAPATPLPTAGSIAGFGEKIIIEPPNSVVSYYLDHLRGALSDGKPAPR